MRSTITLYRPATPRQRDSIARNGWRHFDELSLYQGCFYPMLHPDYARLVARRWNAREYGAGFVLAFRADRQWLSQFQPQTLATETQLEYCIPARCLADFNHHLHGRIRVVESFGIDPQRPRPVIAPASQDWDFACAV